MQQGKTCEEGHRLELPADAGGRYYLAGEPVHCGTPLQLRCVCLSLPLIGGQEECKNGWLQVRFEMARGRPVFYLWLGENIGNVELVELPGSALFRWPAP